MAAVRRSLHGRDNQATTVVGVGERAITIALVAAPLETHAMAGLELHRPLESLKQMIEGDTVLIQGCALTAAHVLVQYLVAFSTQEPRP